MHSEGVGFWALPLSLRFVGLDFPIVPGNRLGRD